MFSMDGSVDVTDSPTCVFWESLLVADTDMNNDHVKHRYGICMINDMLT